MEELESCPFCGGKFEIRISDDEGNPRDSEYAKDPWSGLSYGISHYETDNRDCPIATFKEDEGRLGTFLYDSEEEAIRDFNIRAN